MSGGPSAVLAQVRKKYTTHPVLSHAENLIKFSKNSQWLQAAVFLQADRGSRSGHVVIGLNECNRAPVRCRSEWHSRADIGRPPKGGRPGKQDRDEGFQSGVLILEAPFKWRSERGFRAGEEGSIARMAFMSPVENLIKFSSKPHGF